jgi:hypothetical protein
MIAAIEDGSGLTDNITERSRRLAETCGVPPADERAHVGGQLEAGMIGAGKCAAGNQSTIDVGSDCARIGLLASC